MGRLLLQKANRLMSKTSTRFLVCEFEVFLVELEEETATEGGEVARELWAKSFRSFRQRLKGDPFFSEGNGGRAFCLHIGCAVPHGTCGSSLCLSLDITSAPSMCSH